MAVERRALSITMTADADEVPRDVKVRIAAITLQGASMTPGQRLRLLDNATPPSVIVDYIVPDTTDNADLWGGRHPQRFDGLNLVDGPAAGTWVLTIGCLSIED